MLVNLTINKEGVKDYYKKWMEVCKENNLSDLKTTYEKFLDRFTPIDNEPGFYLENDPGVPMSWLQIWYDEFSRVVDFKDLYDYFPKIDDYENVYDYFENYKPQYGLVDNIGQLKNYYKEEIEDPNQRIVFFLRVISHHPEKAGQEGGFRPHKNGAYLGGYEQIRDHEYYDDCVFEEGYQGYLIQFHLVPVV